MLPTAAISGTEEVTKAISPSPLGHLGGLPFELRELVYEYYYQSKPSWHVFCGRAIVGKPTLSKVRGQAAPLELEFAPSPALLDCNCAVYTDAYASYQRVYWSDMCLVMGSVASVPAIESGPPSTIYIAGVTLLQARTYFPRIHASRTPFQRFTLPALRFVTRLDLAVAPMALRLSGAHLHRSYNAA